MNKDTVIISMASYPARIEYVYGVWASILKQECIEKCHCVLSLEIPEFPNKEKDLPSNLIELVRSKKLEILWHPTHIRSHKKYITPLSKYPDNPLLTIDDDIIREQGWLKRFFDMHEKYPNDILAYSIAYWWDQTGTIHRFKDIIGVRNRGFSGIPNLIYNTAKPSSGAGTFYPAHTFTDPRFFDESLFMSLSPSSDETWAYCFNVIEDRTIRMLDVIEDLSIGVIPESQKVGTSLYKTNNIKGYQSISNDLFDAFPEFKKNLVERSRRIIVSLTSFKSRLKYVPEVVSSILSGTMRPTKIVLTLFKGDLEYVTGDLQSLIDDGSVELIVVNDDIKPHLKYFYVMQKYRNYAIITIDDDVVYTPDLVESLYNEYMKHPNCICARRCHLIKRYKDGNLLPYKSWGWQNKSCVEPRYDLFATGVGGVLYPPDILNIDESMMDGVKACINADDIYLKWLELNKGIKTVWVSNNHLSGLGVIKGSQEIALYKSNCNQNQNDEYLKLFPLPYIKEDEVEKVIVKSIIQPNFAECSGNFCNPVAVFTCCFNRETPKKHVLEGADFYCFTNEPRNIDGWKTIVVDSFIKDPRWGARYIQFHPTRYMQGYDKMIYIDPAADLLPDVNLEFKEAIALADGRPIYEVIEPSLMKMFEMANVKKLVMSKKDDLILYNFKNRETNKLLTSLWANFNRYLHPLRFALALPQYQKYSIGKIKGLA